MRNLIATAALLMSGSAAYAAAEPGTVSGLARGCCAALAACCQLALGCCG